MPIGVYEHARTPLEERLWSSIDKGETDSCWIWRGQINDAGYGCIFVEKGKSPARVHRVVYELLVGPIPVGLHLIHQCDDRYPTNDISYRRCCNPEHLKPGTNTENIERRVALGRSMRGGSHVRARLSDDQVRAVLQKFSRPQPWGEKTRTAKQLGVSPQSLNEIFKGRNWKHLQGGK